MYLLLRLCSLKRRLGWRWKLIAAWTELTPIPAWLDREKTNGSIAMFSIIQAANGILFLSC